jgi:hypothetical protein
MRTLILIFFLFLLLGCKENHKPASTDRGEIADVPNLNSTNYKSGDTVLPFKDCLLSDGNWKAEIKISSDDMMDLSDGIPKRSKMISTDLDVLEKIKNWRFIYTEGDMATVLNTINLFRNDSLILSYQIVLDKQEVGLQSRQYGWMPAVDSNQILDCIKMFK